jgi:hypothetical protein
MLLRASPDSSTMPLTDSISVLGGYEVIARIALAQVTEVKSKPFMRRPPKYVDLRTEILLTLESLAVWMGQYLQTIAFQEHSKKDAPTKLRDLETASKRHSSVTSRKKAKQEFGDSRSSKAVRIVKVHYAKIAQPKYYV